MRVDNFQTVGIARISDGFSGERDPAVTDQLLAVLAHAQMKLNREPHMSQRMVEHQRLPKARPGIKRRAKRPAMAEPQHYPNRALYGKRIGYLLLWASRCEPLQKRWQSVELFKKRQQTQQTGDADRNANIPPNILFAIGLSERCEGSRNSAVYWRTKNHTAVTWELVNSYRSRQRKAIFLSELGVFARENPLRIPLYGLRNELCVGLLFHRLPGIKLELKRLRLRCRLIDFHRL